MDIVAWDGLLSPQADYLVPGIFYPDQGCTQAGVREEEGGGGGYLGAMYPVIIDIVCMGRVETD